jgi:very-short-patch-repair endonuclease
VSDLEQAFLTRWRQLGYPDVWQREYRPFDWRRFRFDLAAPEPHFVAVEVDGGTWVQGRHTTGSGYDSDCLKHNLATAAGWRVFRITASMLQEAPELHLAMIADALGVKQEEQA